MKAPEPGNRIKLFLLIGAISSLVATVILALLFFSARNADSPEQENNQDEPGQDGSDVKKETD